MTVNKYATQAGKRYETQLMKFLRTRGFDVERLRLTGTEDEGDLVVRTGLGRFVIEAKRTKGLDLAGWIREAEYERNNYDDHREQVLRSGFVVVHYARGKGVGGSYVTTTLEEWIKRL